MIHKICYEKQFKQMAAFCNKLGGRRHEHTLTESTVKLFVHSFLHFKCNLMASLHSLIWRDRQGAHWQNRAAIINMKIQDTDRRVTPHSNHSRDVCATERWQMWGSCSLTVSLMQQQREAGHTAVAENWLWTDDAVQRFSSSLSFPTYR